MVNRAQIPTLAGSGLLGQLAAFRHRRLELQNRLARECGDIGWFRLGPVPLLMVSGPALAHSVLVEHAYDFKKSRGLSVFGRPLLGSGLLTQEGDLHKRQRKLLAPLFQQARVAGYAQTMADYAERAQASWDTGKRLDLGAALMTLTLAIAGKTLFDADVAGDAAAIGPALTDAMQYMIDSISSVPAPYWWPGPSTRRMKGAVRTLDSIVYRIIRERRENPRPQGDVLSLLLSAADEQGSLSDEQVRDEVMTLLLAGHETTSNALTWAFSLLLEHPRTLVRVETEIQQTLAGRTPTYDDVQHMPYSLAVLKEAMRLYPPAYLLGRQALKDVELDGYFVKAGTLLMINVYGMHRRPDLFPDPEKFRPERFLASSEQPLPKGAYLPFGSGARVCVGNHFALLEAQLILATLVQRVSFFPAWQTPLDVESLVTLRPKGGLPVMVERRGARVAA